MPSQGESETFGQALSHAMRAARLRQAEVARRLSIDPGQVSRWANDKSIPHIDNLRRLEELLGVDLSVAFSAVAPEHELYLSAPISGLAEVDVGPHRDFVEAIVEAARRHVNSVYWPGEAIRSTDDLLAADLATERNMHAFGHCHAMLYVQFAEVVRPSSAFIEIGLALGMRKKTTLIIRNDLYQAFMLNGFGAVAASFSFLPKARIYTVRSVDEAVSLVGKNGRQLLGLT